MVQKNLAAAAAGDRGAGGGKSPHESREATDMAAQSCNLQSMVKHFDQRRETWQCCIFQSILCTILWIAGTNRIRIRYQAVPGARQPGLREGDGLEGAGAVQRVCVSGAARLR